MAVKPLKGHKFSRIRHMANVVGRAAAGAAKVPARRPMLNFAAISTRAGSHRHDGTAQIALRPQPSRYRSKRREAPVNYRFVSADQYGRFSSREFSARNISQAIAKAAAIGFAFHSFNTNTAQRQELQGQPKFAGTLGPMWDGDAIRYENKAAYERFAA
jgi:hypothetical protein